MTVSENDSRSRSIAGFLRDIGLTISFGEVADDTFLPGILVKDGGLVIDERSRVLRTDGTPVPGLWACGGAAATCFGGAQPGDGAALAAALVEAFRGIIDLSDQLDRIDEALA